MKPIQAKQQLVALFAAMAVTFSIVWTLSGYAYGKPASGLAPTAKHITPTRTCS